LWIGTRLQYLNQVCLISHLKHGHPVTLYCTDTVENVPEGVEVRQADAPDEAYARKLQPNMKP
jgi:hypothetical protein